MKVRLSLVAAAVLALAGVAAGDAARLSVAPAVPLFTPPQYQLSIPPSPAYVTNMVTADFTGDGLDDVLIALGHWPTTEQYPVQLLVNDGAGHLVNGTSSVFQGHVPETVFPYKNVVADFNGDKVADLFIADTGEDVANPRGWYSPLILSAPGGHLVDGTPNLPQQRAYTYYTDAADVNGDGTLDLYLGNTQTVPPEILLNDGQGHFRISPGALPAAIDPPANVTVGRFADTNGDGAPDLIVAGADYSSGAKTFRFPPNTFVLLNDGHGHFSILPTSLPPKPFPMTGEAGEMRVINLNGDATSDLLITWMKAGVSGFYGNWIQVLIGNGDGTFRDETSTRLPQSDNDGDLMPGLKLVDLNRDGALDIATQLLPIHPPPFDPPPPFYLNDGHGFFTPLPPGDNADAGEQYTFMDIDGDGGLDIVYTTGDSRFLVRREIGAPVSTLYAAVDNSIFTLRNSDDTPLVAIRPGAYNVVVHDTTARDGFRLVGPGVDRRTGVAFTGRLVWRVRLKPGAVYRYFAVRHARQALRFSTRR